MSHPAKPYICRLSDLSPEPVDWIWPGYLAAGKLTLIDGDPNQGKSLLALDLAGRLSSGRALPDGFVPPGPQDVALLDGEDGTRDTVIPRLLAAGANLGRIHLLGIDPMDGSPPRAPYIPDDCGLLAEMLQATSARLLIADPLFSFLSRDSSPLNAAAIHRALKPLAREAEKTRSAVLMSRHLTKRVGMRALYRGNGSMALIGQARTAFLVARSPEDPTLNVLACIKSNRAAPAAMGYRIKPVDRDRAILDWTGPVQVTADDLVLASQRSLGESLRQAIAFLEELLRAGRVPSDDVYRQARAAGISDRTLKRAKAELAIGSQKVTCDDRTTWYWTPPNDPLSLSPEEAHRQLLEEFWKGEEAPQPNGETG